MSKRKDRQPNNSGVEPVKPADSRPTKPEPDTPEGPGKRQAAKGEADAKNKAARTGER